MGKKRDEQQQQGGGEAQSQAPSISHKDAKFADFGSGRQKEAQERGYDGYVWQEDKNEYTVAEVVNNDQSGPNKTVHEDHDYMEDDFIRPDKMDLDKK
jgi:hypothetical protein